LNKILFINEGVQRLTDADAAARNRKVQDMAFKNISNVLREATFEEKSQWANEAFMTVHAPASLFPESKAVNLNGPHSHNTLGMVRSLKLIKIVARLTFQRLVNQAAVGHEAAKPGAAANAATGPFNSVATLVEEKQKKQSGSSSKLIPTSSFREGSSATVVPSGQHLSVSVSQGTSSASVGSKHMLHRWAQLGQGPLWHEWTPARTTV